MIETLREYAKLIRLQSLGVSTTSVIGALAVSGFVLDPDHFIILFGIGLLAQIFGFVLNDLMDLDLDKTSSYLTERPLVKGTISKKSVTVLLTVCFILGFTITWIAYGSLLLMGVLLLITLSGSLYDCYGKKFAGSDLFVAIASGLLCLYGALATSTPLSALGLVAWIVIFTAFLQMLYMNIVDGGLKDADHDFSSGVKTLAVKLGVKADPVLQIPNTFKLMAIILRGGSVVLILMPFFMKLSGFHPWQLICLLIMTVGLFYFVLKMLTIKTFNRKQIGTYIRLQELIRYAMVPVMLAGRTGLLWMTILILLPLVWFALSTWFIYGKPMATPKTL